MVMGIQQSQEGSTAGGQLLGRQNIGAWDSGLVSDFSLLVFKKEKSKLYLLSPTSDIQVHFFFLHSILGSE